MFIMSELQDGVTSAHTEHRHETHDGSQRQTDSVRAMAATLPIRLNGKFASTNQLFARQRNETSRIITIKASDRPEYKESSERCARLRFRGTG